MTSSTPPNAPTVRNGITPTGIIIDASVDLVDDISASSSSYGRTILSSLAPSSLTDSFHYESCVDVDTDTPPLRIGSSLSLSLNPSMLNSSVLAPSERNAGIPGQTTLSESSLSSSDNTCASTDSASSNAPYLFANIGRSLMLASKSDANGSEDGNGSPESPSARGAKWWDQLKTDEDWEQFRKNAQDHLNVLVSEEMRDMTGNECIDGNGCSIDNISATKEITHQNNEGYPKVRQWLQGLYETLTTATVHGIISEDNSTKTKYVTLLVKEIVTIRQQLDRLPPRPPNLPQEIPLQDLPKESRDMLIQYRDRLDAWRGQAMPLQEELSKKYVQCQEKLLAAIIDTEETQFWAKTCAEKSHREEENKTYHEGGKKDKWNTVGAVNDDRYIEVIKNKSVLWDDVDETLAISENKCQLTLRAAFAAALTVVAGFFLTLQTKRK